MPQFPLRFLATAVLVVAGTAHAQGRMAKDIVLDQVAAPLVGTTVASPARNDAVVVSVLLESPDGTLVSKSTETLFSTGDRFRVKLLASRVGRVAIYNTTPAGEFVAQPIWRGEVRPGQETITPRLAINNKSGAGLDQLHVVLEPGAENNLISWLGQWLAASKAGARKDIQLDVQSSPTSTYLLTAAGQGVVTTVQIQHR
jgi:hypothetical protein